VKSERGERGGGGEEGNWMERKRGRRGYLSWVVDSTSDLLRMSPQSSQYLLRVLVENNGSLVCPTCEKV